MKRILELSLGWLLLGMIISPLLYSDSGSNWPEALEAQHWPGTYWWVPGSAWREDDIDFNLKTMAEAGIRNVHIVPIYGAKGYEDRYIPYLSPEWLRMFDHVVQQAKALEMNVDMTTGTGWCFGGQGMEGRLGDMVIVPAKEGSGYETKPGAEVERSAPGAEGLMLNPFSPEAMKQYLQRFDAAFSTPGISPPRAQYHDSFEYRGNWSADLPREFQARRGYDLMAHLPELLHNAGEEESRARIKYDYRLTLAELHEETMQVWIDWCHERGMLTRNEAHGSPTNILDLYADSDIPETEMFGALEFPVPGFRVDEEMSRKGDVDLRVCKMASSAAHIAHAPGKQLVSSETCTWLREHWHTNLGQVKLQLDRMFLAGVNHIFYHGTCFSPQDVPWPGWYFYASTHFDWRNSFWRDLPHLNQYAARCQSVLQAGVPANDVLVYWPIHDVWSSPEGLDLRMSVHSPKWMSESAMGRLADGLMARGFSYDFISDELLEKVQAREGQLQTPGATYGAIVVPQCRYMPPETLARLGSLAAEGAAILFDGALPEGVPGLGHQEQRKSAFEQARAAATRAVQVVADIPSALEAVGVKREVMVDAGLQFLRRKMQDGYYYFVVNHTASEIRGWVPLATELQSAVLFDPMTGESGRLAMREGKNGREVYLQLDAGTAGIVRTHSEGVEVAEWNYLKATGEERSIAGPWALTFTEGAPLLPPPATLDALASWTETPGGEAQRFAGTGTYTTHFDLPQDLSAYDWMLDLGDVRESARVRVNGHEAGTLVSLPFRLRIGPYLQAGTNTLEIEVTNLSANRMRALAQEANDWKIMRDINIVTVDYAEFKPELWLLEASGLLGPVKLVAMARLTPGL